MAGLLSGVLFALFSGQPLNLLGSTGPVYIFEKILFEMCRNQEWDYLSLRCGGLGVSVSASIYRRPGSNVVPGASPSVV